MAADGHLVAPYGALRDLPSGREFFMEVFSPRLLALIRRSAESTVVAGGDS